MIIWSIHICQTLFAGGKCTPFLYPRILCGLGAHSKLLIIQTFQIDWLYLSQSSPVYFTIIIDIIRKPVCLSIQWYPICCGNVNHQNGQNSSPILNPSKMQTFKFDWLYLSQYSIKVIPHFLWECNHQNGQNSWIWVKVWNIFKIRLCYPVVNLPLFSFSIDFAFSLRITSVARAPPPPLPLCFFGVCRYIWTFVGKRKLASVLLFCTDKVPEVPTKYWKKIAVL